MGRWLVVALLTCVSLGSFLMALLGWGFGRHDDGSHTFEGIVYMIVFGIAGLVSLAMACTLASRSGTS